MANVSYFLPDVNGEEEIPFETGPITRLASDEPIATPLADALAASYNSGNSDAAGCDAVLMTYEEWVETVGAWTFEPEPSFWEDLT